jgi:hypothetical protein
MSHTYLVLGLTSAPFQEIPTKILCMSQVPNCMPNPLLSSLQYRSQDQLTEHDESGSNACNLYPGGAQFEPRWGCRLVPIGLFVDSSVAPDSSGIGMTAYLHVLSN